MHRLRRQLGPAPGQRSLPRRDVPGNPEKLVVKLSPSDCACLEGQILQYLHTAGPQLIAPHVVAMEDFLTLGGQINNTYSCWNEATRPSTVPSLSVHRSAACEACYVMDAAECMQCDVAARHCVGRFKTRKLCTVPFKDPGHAAKLEMH